MRYRSRDGLCESADASAVALWDSIGDRMADDQRGWVARLRAMGVKAAHPDDGWVKRNETPPKVFFSYPAFNDGVQEGDLIALGAPYHHGGYKWGTDRWKYRLVRVTGSTTHGVMDPMTYWHFEDTGVRLPPRPSWFKRRGWRRGK